MLQSFKYIVSFLLIILFFSCDKQVEIPVVDSQYFIKITLDDFKENTIYIYRLTPKLSLIDSATTVNNFTSFIGEVDMPERFVLRIKDVEGAKLVILENDSITIEFHKNDIKQSILKGSKINDELIAFQSESNQITSKIELLFPDLQRARLNNDVEMLREISNKIEIITQDNIDFNFEYIKQHPDSFIAAMILNDLSKRDEIDADKISKAFQSLSKKVKQSVDAKEVELFLAIQL